MLHCPCPYILSKSRSKKQMLIHARTSLRIIWYCSIQPHCLLKINNKKKQQAAHPPAPHSPTTTLSNIVVCCLLPYSVPSHHVSWGSSLPMPSSTTWSSSMCKCPCQYKAITFPVCCCGQYVRQSVCWCQSVLTSLCHMRTMKLTHTHTLVYTVYICIYVHW